MQQSHARAFHETDDEVEDRQTASLGAVAITLLLLVIGLFLVRELQADGVVQGGGTSVVANQITDVAT